MQAIPKIASHLADARNALARLDIEGADPQSIRYAVVKGAVEDLERKLEAAMARQALPGSGVFYIATEGRC